MTGSAAYGMIGSGSFEVAVISPLQRFNLKLSIALDGKSMACNT
jgi:hypothetical protein